MFELNWIVFHLLLMLKSISFWKWTYSKCLPVNCSDRFPSHFSLSEGWIHAAVAATNTCLIRAGGGGGTGLSLCARLPMEKNPNPQITSCTFYLPVAEWPELAVCRAQFCLGVCTSRHWWLARFVCPGGKHQQHLWAFLKISRHGWMLDALFFSEPQQLLMTNEDEQMERKWSSPWIKFSDTKRLERLEKGRIWCWLQNNTREYTF